MTKRIALFLCLTISVFAQKTEQNQQPDTMVAKLKQLEDSAACAKIKFEQIEQKIHQQKQKPK